MGNVPIQTISSLKESSDGYVPYWMQEDKIETPETPQEDNMEKTAQNSLNEPLDRENILSITEDPSTNTQVQTPLEKPVESTGEIPGNQSVLPGSDSITSLANDIEETAIENFNNKTAHGKQ